mgnify:CR=1 FL=1
MSDQKKGPLLVIFAAVLWGISGISAQVLFENSSISTGEVISIRLIFSGAILLVSSLIKNKKSAFEICKDPRDIIDVLLFSVIGTAGVQYTFFAAIKESNSATASVLQYVYPVIVMICCSVINRKRPRVIQLVTILMAVSGTFLITTNGSLTNLSISAKALAWGLSSALCIAFYTIHSGRIIKKYGTVTVNGWGMTIGGILTLVFATSKPSRFTPEALTILLLIVIIFFGTLIPFCMYLAGVQLTGGIAASALASFETLTVLILSALFLKMKFSPWEITGMVLIISTVVIPAVISGGKRQKHSGTKQIMHDG